MTSKKTFTADEFRRNPAQVYLSAVTNGGVIINHGNYPSITFELKARKRGIKDEAKG